MLIVFIMSELTILKILQKVENHINGVIKFLESSWNTFIRKYNGIDRNAFPLFIKECEFRFNYGSPKTTAQIKKPYEWQGFHQNSG